MQRRVRGASSTVARLRAHPLLEPIKGSDQSYLIKGGWAHGFLFLYGRMGNRCVLIDPGVRKKMESLYKRGVGRRILDMLGEDRASVMRRLQTRSSRLELLKRIVVEIGKHELAETSREHNDLFLERATELAKLVVDTGIVIDAIYATHHHIDHLGVGARLRTMLGIEPKVFIPDPAVFDTPDRTGTDWYPEELGQADIYQPIRGDLGIRIIDVSGHTKMRGFLLPDGNLIVGDLLASENAWGCCVIYMEDLGEHTKSLGRIAEVPYGRLLLGHGAEYVIADPEAYDLILANMEKTEDAFTAARGSEDAVEAAERYLRPTDGQVGRGYIAHALITARHIEGYRVSGLGTKLISNL